MLCSPIKIKKRKRKKKKKRKKENHRKRKEKSSKVLASCLASSIEIQVKKNGRNEK